MADYLLEPDENITFDPSSSPEDGTAKLTVVGNNRITVDGLDIDISIGEVPGVSQSAQTIIDAANNANVTIDDLEGYHTGSQSLTLNIDDTSSISYGAEEFNPEAFSRTTINFTGDGGGVFKLQLPPGRVPDGAILTGLSNGDTFYLETDSPLRKIGDVRWDASSNELRVTTFEPDGSRQTAVTFKVEGDIPADATFENVGNGQITFKSPCYLRGTHIATSEDEKRIEDLQAGDQVLTVSGRLATVKWVGYFKLHSNRIPAQHATRAYPICITAGALAPNIPTRDLYVSPGHHMYFDGKLIPALLLVNGKTITQDFSLRAFEYFHVELDRFDIILAEGAAAESYVDAGNRSAFQNVNIDSMLADFGPAKGRPTIDGIKVVRSGPVVQAVHQRLLERAETLAQWAQSAGPNVGLTSTARLSTTTQRGAGIR
ncbi:Hint domain-containing protein [Bordetella tumulicola]|uniref:Hint domain-containing protein n=1 Tax=Bordetella tumulicola TaxID=1649133 RepID=UPI0039EF06FF